MAKQLKPVPTFSDEAEERAFWESHDTTDYVDWSNPQSLSLPNLKPDTTTIALRLPQHVLDAIKEAAGDRSMPYEALINVWLEEKLSGN